YCHATSRILKKSEIVHTINHNCSGFSYFIKPIKEDFYQNWAHGKSFVKGDVLGFKSGLEKSEKVAEVTEKAYDLCEIANTISSAIPIPINITLNRTGAYYFISTIADNCWNGQKLNITVGDESNPTAAVPAAGPSLTTSPGTSIPPLVTNSASSLVSTLSPVFFMAIALVLMC
ncbi:hypothetical protein ES332_D13G250900v1, partial [Gossypium tomentosum]